MLKCCCHYDVLHNPLWVPHMFQLFLGATYVFVSQFNVMGGRFGGLVVNYIVIKDKGSFIAFHRVSWAFSRGRTICKCFFKSSSDFLLIWAITIIFFHALAFCAVLSVGYSCFVLFIFRDFILTDGFWLGVTCCVLNFRVPFIEIISCFMRY